MIQQLDLARHPVEVAPDLIGWTLVHRKRNRVTAGRIVEVEAYGGRAEDDCAHSFRGPSPRNRVMFGPPGRLYVYFTYGMHYCANVVAHAVGAPGGAVLLRALEPTDGVDLMRKRRGLSDERLLCSGPARLVEAMGLGRADNGRAIGTSTLWLEDRRGPTPEVATGPRIGVRCEAAGRPWRFVESGSRWLSKPLAGS